MVPFSSVINAWWLQCTSECPVPKWGNERGLFLYEYIAPELFLLLMTALFTFYHCLLSTIIFYRFHVIGVDLYPTFTLPYLIPSYLLLPYTIPYFTSYLTFRYLTLYLTLHFAFCYLTLPYLLPYILPCFTLHLNLPYLLPYILLNVPLTLHFAYRTLPYILHYLT